MWGFILTLPVLGTFHAALKTVLTSHSSNPLGLFPTRLYLAGRYACHRQTRIRTLPNVHNGNYNPPVALPFRPTQTPPPPPPSPPTPFINFPPLIVLTSQASRSLINRSGFVTKRFDLDFGLSDKNVVSTSIKLHPGPARADVVTGVCTGYAWASGELERAMVNKGPGLEGWSPKSATVRVFVEYQIPIVYARLILANVKQILTVLLAMYMFHLTITPANSISIALALAGGAWYGALEYEEKKNRLRMV
ncbi:UAA transporter [Tulasnella sp. 424]|nr:UAA transporter [Tulasnella sp. 424]